MRSFVQRYRLIGIAALVAVACAIGGQAAKQGGGKGTQWEYAEVRIGRYKQDYSYTADQPGKRIEGKSLVELTAALGGTPIAKESGTLGVTNAMGALGWELVLYYHNVVDSGMEDKVWTFKRQK